MIKVEGLGTILANIDNAVLDTVEMMNNRMELAGAYTHEMMLQQVGLTDHTQYDLDVLGNPYSRRKKYDSLHGDDGLVHKQSGLLYNDVRVEMNFDGTTAKVAIGVPDSNPHAQNLIAGKPRQRPRPFVRRTAEESKEGIESILAGR